MIIEDVRFEGFEKIDLQSLMPLIDIKKGAAYSTLRIRKSIKHLYLKGLFSRLYIDALKGEKGVILTFHAEPKQWISDIRIKGNKSLRDDEILPLLPAKVGHEYSEDILPALKKKIKALYEREGYYNSNVTIAVRERDLSTELTINVDVGPPCLLSEILFLGNEAIPAGKLKKALASKIHKRINLTTFEKDRKELIKLYHKSGYLEVAIEDADLLFDEVKQKAYAQHKINEGKKINIIFQGNSYFSKSYLLKSIIRNGSVTINDPLIARWEAIIKSQYMEKGFSFIKVKGEILDNEREKTISITIEEGKRYIIGDVTFSGNMLFKTKELIKRISLKGALMSKPFSESMVDNSLDTIKQLYQERGFMEATIKKDITFSEDDRSADINILIVEGIQIVVANVVIEADIGNKQVEPVFTHDELLQLTEIKRGMPFNRELLNNASLKLVEAYSKRGHIYATVKAENKFSPDMTNVNIHLKIKEGLEVRRGKVIISGNRLTKDHVLLRELTLKENNLFDREKILEDRQRIYKLGLFRGVRYNQINKEKKGQTKDMHLEVTEKKPGAFEIGLGYATDIGARAFSELSYLNLWGAARSIKLRGEINDLEKKVLVGYKEPRLMGRQMDGRINLLHHSDDKESYDLKKNGLILGLDKELSDFFKVSIQYEIDKNRYSNVQPGTAQTEGKSTIASLGPLLIRDSRDDPFSPLKGSVNLLRYELAKEAFASDEEFQKITAQSSWYKAMTANSVGAVSLRGGYIDLLGSTASVPIDERFFLGGRTTVRGFKQDSIGPANLAGTAIGGEKMLNINVELRLRLTGNIGGLLFYDAGNIWQDTESAHLSEVRTSVGCGIRYLTPVGPLSIEYGQKLDRKKDESTGEWYFTIGNIF